MHNEEGSETIINGRFKTGGPLTPHETSWKRNAWLVLSINVHTFPRVSPLPFIIHLKPRGWLPQFKTVKFHSSMPLTKHGATMVFILQSSRQRELKKIAEINPSTSISVLILCNYTVMGRHTEKEENMVLILKLLAMVLRGCFSAPGVHQNHLSS